MRINTTLWCLALLSMAACGQSDKTGDQSEGGTLKLSFGGKTKIYTDARFSAGKLGSIESIDINAGSDASDYLSLTVYGLEPGVYPYKKNINEYQKVSQVEYKIDGELFNHYFARICPDTSGYYSKGGEIKIEEFEVGKHLKGTFSGDLIDSNGEDECHPTSKSFSGEFDITMP